MSHLRSFCWAVGTVVVAAAVSWFVARFTVDHTSRSREETSSEKGFHQWLHENLDISAEQERSLYPIERAFETERRQLRRGIEAAGRELAEALREHGADSPEVERGRERLTEMQGRLQQATLDHFFAMKEHLDEVQGEKLLQWTYESMIHGHGD